MQKKIVLIVGGSIVLLIGFLFGKAFTSSSIRPLIAQSTITPAPTSEVTPTGSSSFVGDVGINVSLTPTPTLTLASPFGYTPLPATNGSPANDIVEISPLTTSRTKAQVDDWITFTATIKNQAPYEKVLYNLCFQSTDGNFGCVFHIHLSSGQTYAIQNVGSWKIAGQKQVWLQWTQDNYNVYRPVGEVPVTVNIID